MADDEVLLGHGLGIDLVARVPVLKEIFFGYVLGGFHVEAKGRLEVKIEFFVGRGA